MKKRVIDHTLLTQWGPNGWQHLLRGSEVYRGGGPPGGVDWGRQRWDLQVSGCGSTERIQPQPRGIRDLGEKGGKTGESILAFKSFILSTRSKKNRYATEM